MKWLDEIEERAKKATVGPWRAWQENVILESGIDPLFKEHMCDFYLKKLTFNDYEFVAHSRTDIPKLCEALRKAIEMAEFYKRNGYGKPADAFLKWLEEQK